MELPINEIICGARREIAATVACRLDRRDTEREPHREMEIA